MRYMMLIHHDDAAMAAADQKALWADYAAFNEALAKADGSSSGERLEPAKAGTIVRSNGVLDGPYADTKEQFAGYFFVEAADLDVAVAWAKRCPSSRYGAIEIRPVHVPEAGNWK
ncbi:MAG: YciI family protein [Devosia sp.]